MDRSVVAFLALAVIACASQPTPAVAPAPGAPSSVAVASAQGVESAPSSGAITEPTPVAGLDALPLAAIAIDVDSLARQLAAQDSAADAAALEALEGARPDTAEPIEAPAWRRGQRPRRGRVVGHRRGDVRLP